MDLNPRLFPHRTCELVLGVHQGRLAVTQLVSNRPFWPTKLPQSRVMGSQVEVCAGVSVEFLGGIPHAWDLIFAVSTLLAQQNPKHGNRFRC